VDVTCICHYIQHYIQHFSTKRDVIPVLGDESEAGCIGISFPHFPYVHGQNWRKISWGYKRGR